MSTADGLFGDRITYRGYVFVNTALSSIQKGVQGSHALVELFNQYALRTGSSANDEKRDVLSTWSRMDKTLIYLDGGFSKSLIEGYNQLRDYCWTLKLPCAFFQEDKDTLNEAVTAYAAIIPSTVFDISEELLLKYDQEGDYVKLIKQTGEWTDQDRSFEAKCELNRFIRQFRLAI